MPSHNKALNSSQISILLLGKSNDFWVKTACESSRGTQFRLELREQLPENLEQEGFQIILLDQLTSQDTVATCRNRFLGPLFVTTTSKNDWQSGRQALRDGATYCFPRTDGIQTILRQIHECIIQGSKGDK